MNGMNKKIELFPMKIVLSILLFGFAFFTNAQSVQKIGYAETDYIMGQLPEFKKLDDELKTHYSQLENQMKLKADELQTKVKAYQSMPASTPDAIKADK